MDENTFLSINEAAEYLNMSVSELYNLIISNSIKSTRVASLVLFTKEELERFKARNSLKTFVMLSESETSPRHVEHSETSKGILRKAKT